MKYAIFSDIHANIEALDAVLRDQKEQGCSHMACLGDIVGFGPDPQACVDYIRALGMPAVKGDLDEDCSSNISLDALDHQAARMVLWTRSQLREDDRKWLRELPYVLQIEDFSIVHALSNESRPRRFAFEKLAAAASVFHQKPCVCFFGHTHVPAAFSRDTVVRGGSFTRLGIKPGTDYFINVGSVGESRGGESTATYVIYDVESREVELRRLHYDLSATRSKLLKPGF